MKSRERERVESVEDYQLRERRVCESGEKDWNRVLWMEEQVVYWAELVCHFGGVCYGHSSYKSFSLKAAYKVI